jgi:integrase
VDLPRLDQPIQLAIGSISEITPLELLNVFRRLEARGKHETSHRTKQRCGQVFRYAVATGRALRDPTQDLRGALAPVVTTHHVAITEPRRVGDLLRALHPLYESEGRLRLIRQSSFDRLSKWAYLA